MANTFAPFGFSDIGSITGQSPNFGQAQRLISASNATPIYFGDPVVDLGTGYIGQAPGGSSTGAITAIFKGCFYSSLSNGGAVKFSNYWPGSDAIGDVTAWISHHPESVFVAQSGNGGPVPLNAIGANIGFQIGTGNTRTGYSGAYVDFATIATTSTLPFIITGIVTDPPGSNGSDTTTAFNWVVVAFNNQSFKTLTGV